MLRFKNLSKNYGNHQALQSINFDLAGNQVVGLLGPNGAGKSTCMKILCGAMFSSSGEYFFGDQKIDRDTEAGWRKDIGFLPERPPVYESLSVEENLQFWGGLRGLHGKDLEKRIDYAVERTGLVEVRHRPGEVLSKGYRQRLGIAQALLGNAKVLILDEPMSGLDPQQMIEIRSLVKELGNEHLVIFSSHQLSEVEQICSHFLFLKQGQLLASGSKDEIDTQDNSSRLVLSTFDELSLDSSFPYDWGQLGKNSYSFVLEKKPEQMQGLLQELLKRQITPKELRWEENNLESLFLKLLDKG